MAHLPTLTAVLALLLLLAWAPSMRWFTPSSRFRPAASRTRRSIAAFDGRHRGHLIVFMFLAGTSFSLLHRAWSERRLGRLRKMQIQSVRRSPGFGSLGIAWSLWRAGCTAPNALRHGVFQAVSIGDGHRLCQRRLLIWPSFASSIVFALMFVGQAQVRRAATSRCAIWSSKHGVRELRRLVHPPRSCLCGSARRRR